MRLKVPILNWRASGTPSGLRSSELLPAAAVGIFLVIYGEAKMNTSAEVIGIVGLFTSVTGTLVGAFFGLQVGSAGVEHDRSNRRKAEEIARMALAHLHPDVAKELAPSLKSQ